MKSETVFSIVLLLSLLIIPVCWGQGLGFLDGIEARSYCETVINHVEKGRIEEAFVLLGSQWPLPVRGLEQVQEQAERTRCLWRKDSGHPVATGWSKKR